MLNYIPVEKRILNEAKIWKEKNGESSNKNRLTKKQLIEKVSKHLPDYLWDREYPDLFGKYGTMYSNGFSEEWIWYDKDNCSLLLRAHGKRPLEEASKDELLEMWGLMSDFWCGFYKEQYNALYSKCIDCRKRDDISMK